jgi:hypothetical protein
LEWLTENVELVDENGDPVDRAALEFPEEETEEDAVEEATDDVTTEAEGDEEE